MITDDDLDTSSRSVDSDDNATTKPSAQLDNDDLLIKFKNWERNSRSHSSQWRRDARDDYDLVAGEQWSSDDKAALLEQMRQPIVFNRTAPMVDAVIGAEILNRQDVQYIPREMGDVKVQEILTAANDWARQQCDAEDEESDGFHDAIVCGMGWTETAMAYDDDPQGNIVINRVDPLEMWWDPNAKKRNLADRRYQFRRRGFDAREFQDKFPGKLEQVRSSLGSSTFNTSEDMGEDFRPPYDKYKEDGTTDRAGQDEQLIWVNHWQWFEVVEAYTVAIPAPMPPVPPQQMGQNLPAVQQQPPTIKSLLPDEYKQLVMQALGTGGMPPKAVKGQKKVFYEAFVAGAVVLSRRTLDGVAFTFNCITGKRDRNKNTWFGIVRAMRDPQRWANKWLTQILHIINSNSKGGLMYETGAFKNPTKALDEWSRPDSSVEVATGKLEKILPKPPVAFPVGHDKLLEFAIGSFPQVTGINLELLGMVDREQSGVLEQHRKRSGYAILAVYFDSLRRYRKMQGRVMLHYIQNYISDGRLIRIKGDDGMQQYVPLVRKADMIEYDIIVDEAPMSQNQKEMVWGALMQMMPMMSKMQVPTEVWAEFVKYSPLPSSMTDKIAQILSQPNPQAQQAQQLQLQDQQADVDVKRSTAAFNWARAYAEGMPDQVAAESGPTPSDEELKQAQALKARADASASVAKAEHAQSGTVLNIEKARQARVETAMAPITAAHDMAIARHEAALATKEANKPDPRPSAN